MKHISTFIPEDILKDAPLHLNLPSFFAYRRITPLFAGTPEWIVEAAQPEGMKLVCWCSREFDAAMITSALNGDRNK